MIEIGIIKGTPVHKIIHIRDKNQVIKAMYCIAANDVLKYTLMGEHAIEISFELNKNVSFNRSDYIEWDGAKYTLRNDYQAEQINKRKYKYTLQFEAIEMFFQDIQYYYLNQGLKESEWRLIGNPEYFIQLVVDNANRYFGTTDFKVGTIETTETKDIAFQVNTNTFDALTQIAETYEAEWHVTGNTIHLLNKVSFGDFVDLETEVSVLSMKRTEGENSNRYTRIVALGSTRNIPKNYRPTAPNESVDAIYPKRLRIPTSKGDVIDAYPNMLPDEVVEGTVIFDEVYPHRVGTIEAVGIKEYQDVDEETKEVTKWNAYKIKDTGIHFKEEYLLPGEELRLQFTSGDLNGLDHALKFHKEGFSNTDNSQYFEIIRNEDYGKPLPNDILKPKIGDTYVLYGFNIALVGDIYVPLGEQELYDTAMAWLQKQLSDTSVYECPTVIQHFVDNQMDLDIGQKVRLIKEIGNNRNLIPNTNQGISGWDKNIQNGTHYYLETEALGVHACKFITNVISTGWHVLTHIINRPLIKNNAQYTLSMDVYCEFDTTGNFRFMAGNGTNQLVYFGAKSIPANTWTRIELTATTTPETTTNQVLYIDGFNKVGAVTFANLKLEEGNKATSWTPAPEDVEGAIRTSRIMGFEKKLNNKFDAIYTVGDNSTYSRLGAIEDEIKELQVAGISYVSTGGNGVYVIKQFDATPPTDYNVFSAKASDAKYLNKQTGGTVQGNTTFAKNMQVQGAVISDVLQNSTFTAGQFGSGFQIKRDANGQSYMEVDNILVRRETVFNRLTIAEIKSVGGTILLSLASMVLFKIEVKTDTWKCFFDTAEGTIPNDFAVGDQAICRKFIGKDIKYYWALITAIGSDYIELSKSDKDGAGTPAIGDEVVQLGNRTDSNRQASILISAYGSDAPSINQYAGINSYDLTGKEVTTISPQGNKFTGSFTISTNGTTAPVYKERDIFANGTVYYLNDRVSYLGSHWVCIVNTTITTPSEASSTWRKETAGQGDIDNAINDISVGTRNLFLDSANFGSPYWASRANVTLLDEYYRECRIYRTANPWSAMTYKDFDNLDLSKEYVLSFYVKSNIDLSSHSGSLFSYGLANRRVVTAINKITKEWQRLSIKGVLTNNIDGIRVELNTAIAGGYVYFCGFKLEEGNKATDWSPAPEDVQAGIDNAQADATNAQSAANKAQADADKANSVIADIANDNKLTPNEKQIIAKDWGDIQKEYPSAISEANKFVVSTTAYTTAYNALNSYITPLLADLTTTNDIVGSTFRLRFNTYRDEYVKLLNGISSKAKALADAAQTAANNAQKEAEKVRTEYKADFIVLDTKIASKVSQTDFNALGNRVSTTESNITQIATSITSVVETVADIQIGANNLYPKSSRWLIITSTGTIAYNQPDKHGKNEAVKFEGNLTARRVKGIKENGIYSFGFWAKSASGNSSIVIDICDRFGIPNRFTIGQKWEWIKSEGATVVNYSESTYNFIDLEISGSIIACDFKLEKGNKCTDWSLNPNDVDNKINDVDNKTNNAQTTADSKNRTYYQDEAPTPPSGGHKVGDLWYKTSLVDSSGNINANTTQNIYQLQYRWDGAVWRQINWSVAKSKIEQTDSSISLVVEKTGINNVGAGSSLHSMILQTEDKIILEVSKVQIGGRNMIPNTNQGISGWDKNIQNGTHYYSETEALGVHACKFTTNVISSGWHVLTHIINRPLIKNNAQYTLSMDVYCEFDTTGNFRFMAGNGTNQLVYFGAKSIPANTWTRIELTATTTPETTTNQVLYIDGFNKVGAVTFANLKLEEGNKATSWIPAIEDVQNGIDNAQTTADSKTTLAEVSSSLTITDNKINLVAKTIELTGHTIAKSIEAQDLKVGSRTGLSALEVMKDGTFYAKGSTSDGSMLELDSAKRLFIIRSPITASGQGESITGISNIILTPDVGGIMVDGATAVSPNSMSFVSNSGLFANTAGQSINNGFTGDAVGRASVVGLGWGDVNIDTGDGKDNFVAGIYGRTSNRGTAPGYGVYGTTSNTAAPSYGGYFNMLRANGIVFNLKIIKNTTTITTRLDRTDSYIIGASGAMQNITLPSNVYPGTVIWFKQWNTGYMRISPGPGYKIYDDASSEASYDVTRGVTAMLTFVGEDPNGYGTWMFGRFGI